MVYFEVRDKRERLRGAQADFDRISELHRLASGESNTRETRSARMEENCVYVLTCFLDGVG